MGLIHPTRARQRRQQDGRAGVHEGAGDVLAEPEHVSGREYRLQGTCWHCHKPQVVDSATSWVTTRCSYCGAAITVHA